MTAAQTLTAVNDVRTALAAFVVAAGAAGTLWFTGHSYALNREGHVTDRYTRQLASLAMTVRRFASVASMPSNGSATTQRKTEPPSSMCSAPSSESGHECQTGKSVLQRIC